MKKLVDHVRTATRKTRQRQTILEELRKRHDHPTAEEIHAGVREKLPRISLGTVYRNLEFLAGLGEIRRIGCVGQSMRFDGDISNHQHAVCLGCGRLEDVECAAQPLPEDGSCGISILRARVIYEGFCRQCAENLAKENKQ